MLTKLLGLPASFIGQFEGIQLFLVVIAVLLSLLRWGTLGRGFARLEANWARIAARPYLSIGLAAGVALLARGLLIPLLGAPDVIVPDEASIILQAHTYLAGRLANPPLLLPDFESIYVISSPSYASMYPMGRALTLLIGQLVGLGFWGGVWLTMAALAATTYWGLKAWVPARYALVAAGIVVVRYCLFSYWANSYFGPEMTALGGLVLMGAYRRLSQRPSLGQGVVLGLGVGLMLVTRPFEALVFSLAFGVALIVQFLTRSAERPRLLAAGLAAVLIVGVGVAATAAHDQAVTGHWQGAPYDQYKTQVQGAPAFLMAKAKIGATARYDANVRYVTWEARGYQRTGLRHVIGAEVSRLFNDWIFYVGVAFTLPFLFGLRILSREPVLAAAALCTAVAVSMTSWDFAHYASPAFGLFMLIIIAGFERMRPWSWRGVPVGLNLSRALPLVAVAGLILPFSAVLSADGVEKLGYEAKVPRACCWIRPRSEHGAVERYLSLNPGRDLVMVDTGPRAPLNDPLVYNTANPGAERIVWVNDDPALNRQAITLFPGRRLWRLGWTATGKPCLQPYGAPGAACALLGPVSRLDG